MTLPTEGVLGAVGVGVGELGQATVAPLPVPQQPPVQTAAQQVVKQRPDKFFLTGRKGAGKHYLSSRLNGVTILDLSAAPLGLCQKFLGTAHPALIAELKAWGDGVISQQFPLSWVRACVQHLVNLDGFGKAHFWIDQLLTGSKGRVCILGVESAEDLLYLRNKLGFVHYHVMASPATISARSGNPTGPAPADAFNGAIDQDVVRKVSAQRTGERLRAIWNDDAQPVSDRFFSAAHWLAELGGSSTLPAAEVQLPEVSLE
jgi:hypothetical protein